LNSGFSWTISTVDATLWELGTLTADAGTNTAVVQTSAKAAKASFI
jgi:hypothetical protein